MCHMKQKLPFDRSVTLYGKDSSQSAEENIAANTLFQLVFILLLIPVIR